MHKVLLNLYDRCPTNEKAYQYHQSTHGETVIQSAAGFKHALENNNHAPPQNDENAEPSSLPPAKKERSVKLQLSNHQVVGLICLPLQVRIVSLVAVFHAQ